MSCLERRPYFRGVLIEGFHCMYSTHTMTCMSYICEVSEGVSCDGVERCGGRGCRVGGGEEEEGRVRGGSVSCVPEAVVTGGGAGVGDGVGVDGMGDSPPSPATYPSARAAVVAAVSLRVVLKVL